MVGLYTDPKGEDIFKSSSTVTNTAAKTTYNESEMMNLRRRINELEKDLGQRISREYNIYMSMQLRQGTRDLCLGGV